MAYYSGTAGSLTDLRTALLAHAVADGWTLTGDVLSKSGVYFRIREVSGRIELLGCTDNAVSNPAPGVVAIGKIWGRTGFTTQLITFPCNYEVFGFTQELYLVVNYEVSKYQWMAFGKSTVPGLAGTGAWCGATAGTILAAAKTSTDLPWVLWLSVSVGGVGSYPTNCGALFWTTQAGQQAARNCWVHHGLDSLGWFWGGGGIGEAPIGVRYFDDINAFQPSAWNSEAALLPMQAWIRRASYKSSLVADLEHARNFRIDNLNGGDILTIGSDKWKVFPWYVKDSTYRNGTTDSTLPCDHSGTLGWAIRYEGQ